MIFMLPSKDKLPALIVLNRSIERGIDLPADFDQQISILLGVEDAVWSGLIGAFALRDMVFAGYDYLNVDMREYCVGTEKEYFLVKLESEYGESSGDYHTRAGALLDAILDHIVFEVEEADG